jgi:SAM-dependent methyltransferase
MAGIITLNHRVSSPAVADRLSYPETSEPMGWSPSQDAGPVDVLATPVADRLHRAPGAGPAPGRRVAGTHRPAPWRESPAGTGLARSFRLFNACRREQVDPDGFYSLLAADSVNQVGRYASLLHASVLDVGGGAGYFRQAFQDAGARYLWVEADTSELTARGVMEPGAVLGSALALPFRDGALDVCYSSNVLEHVADPWLMAAEMIRVTRPGGLIFLTFTNWLSPWGGHETSPWHYLGGEYAARRYERTRGNPAKNRYGASLFKVSVAEALAWARARDDVRLLDALPRYLPEWAKPMLRMPGVREVVTWNLTLVMRRGQV